jgi:hypothetical protein
LAEARERLVDPLHEVSHVPHRDAVIRNVGLDDLSGASDEVFLSHSASPDRAERLY